MKNPYELKIPLIPFTKTHKGNVPAILNKLECESKFIEHLNDELYGEIKNKEVDSVFKKANAHTNLLIRPGGETRKQIGLEDFTTYQISTKIM